MALSAMPKPDQAIERGPDVEHSAQHPVVVDHAGLSHALGAPASVDLVDIARTKGRQCRPALPGRPGC